MTPIPGFHAVVPAGGSGTRLWPLSRKAHPKFLLDPTGSGRTMLQATCDRLAPIAEGITVVTGRAHAAEVTRQVGGVGVPVDVVAEPGPRDSMAAIGLAAALLVRADPDVVIGSFAADHVVPDGAAFAAAVATAVAAARGGAVVTLGIRPTAPSTAFGYVRVGAPAGEGVRAVERFVEKPDAATAARYLAGGDHLWNAGMYVARASVLLEHLHRYHPDLARGLVEIADAWADPARAAWVDERWAGLLSIPIDRAISEPLALEGGVAVVPVDFVWDDLGDWDVLGQWLPAAVGEVRVLGDAARVTAIDSPGAVVAVGERRVVLLGVPDAVVVETPDALLVTSRAHAQRVKEAVDAVAAAGARELL